MKKSLFLPILITALLIVSLFIINSCKKEKINIPPTISITSPEDGVSITHGSEVTIRVNAADSDGSIAGVGFFVDGISAEIVTASPYVFQWQTNDVAEGSHVIKATATDDEGSMISAQITIHLGNLPVADFISDKANDTVPLTVHFTDQSTNEPDSWSWNFGDGGTSTEQNPSHTYADTGSFTVSLTATNDFGSSTETKENYIIGGSVVKADFVASDTNGLVPFSVYFTDQSNSNPISWSWDFGDGKTSTEQNPSHTYTEVGFYTVKLIATNAYGTDVEIKSNYIKGGAIPVAEFSTNLINGVAPLTVEFIDLSTQNPTSWQWDFGDGTNSSEQNPTHIYNAAGTYTVSLTATNEYGENTITKIDLVTVGDFPTVDFSANPLEGVAPLTVNFSNESSENSTSWAWDYGDGNNSTIKNPTHTYTKAGNYDVSLTATNQYGSDTKTKTEYIHVLAVAPEISIVDIEAESDWDYWVVGKNDYFYVDSENDIPQSALFHSSQANKDFTSFFTNEGKLDKLVVDDHIFVFKNFNGTKVDIGILYPDSQTEILRNIETGYTWPTLSLKSTNASESWSDLIGTTANLIAGIPCMLTAVQAQSTIGLASGILEWTCGNELLSLSINLNAQEIILHNGAESYVNLYDVNSTAVSCGSNDPIACISDIAAAASQFLAIQQALVETRGDVLEEIETEMLTPVAEFTANKTTGSAPVSITFTDLSTQNPSIWAWDFGDGASSTEQNPAHTYQQPGIYSVSLTVTNEYGTDEIVKTNYIVLINAPTANFTANKTTGAVPLIVTFTDLSTNNPNRWEWNFGDGESSISKNPTHIYTTAGNFTVTLKARNDYGSDTKTKTNYISTGTAPVAAFTATPTSGTAPLTVNFSDQSSNSPTTWLWDFGDGNTSNLQSPSYTFATAGTYTVKLTATNQFGLDVETKSNHIVVSPPGTSPVAAFTATPTSGNAPLAVNFTDQSTNNPTSWTWNFGDGNTSNLQNPSHTYSSAGTYSISLVATNAFGTDLESKPSYVSVTSGGSIETGTITDIEGNVYNTVKIGDQWWMAENLASTKYRDGTEISYKPDDTDWVHNSSEPGYGWYNDNEAAYKDDYGALYNWLAVNTKKLCPTGWHIPTSTEWTILSDYLGGYGVAGGKLKETGTVHWSSPNTGATNISGFTALPGGYRSSLGSVWIGTNGVWWSSSKTEFGTPIGRGIFNNDDIIYIFTVDSEYGSSIRCIKD